MIEKSNGTIKWIKDEVKLVYITIYITALIVGGGLFNYYSLRGILENTVYRVDKIEEARASMWTEQKEFNKTATECVNDLKLSVAEIKAKQK